MTKRALLKEVLILSAGAAVMLGVYLLASRGVYRLGFPLDDAWIHQTYARNLALRGEWAFLPGQLSAGSTAPLWSLLLAAGYGLGLAPLAWTYFLGWAALVGLAWMGNRLGRDFLAEPQAGGGRTSFPWLGLFLAGEWHLVWAAASGMETALYAFLILSVFWLLARRSIPALAVGLLCGLAIWVRPDGLTLVGPLVFVIGLSRSTVRARLQGVAWGLAGLGLGLIPYLFFNHSLGGAWWPNTFYAKQAEYAITLQTPFLFRLGRLALLPLVGAGLLLVPGCVYALWRAWQTRHWATLAAGLWWGGYTALYALALPVDYQHGRYLIPAMPVIFLLGWAGSVDWLRRWGASPRQRLARFGGVTLLALIWVAFIFQGALAYGQDVAIIETEMVPAAHWLAENTPPDARVAAHDIGAIGYYSGRTVLDLAGLVSPEVIPFIRSEAGLAAYLDRRGAAYLVTFPGWYPELVQRARLLYTSEGQFSPPAGGENMAIYQWK